MENPENPSDTTCVARAFRNATTLSPLNSATQTILRYAERRLTSPTWWNHKHFPRRHTPKSNSSHLRVAPAPIVGRIQADLMQTSGHPPPYCIPHACRSYITPNQAYRP